MNAVCFCPSCGRSTLNMPELNRFVCMTCGAVSDVLVLLGPVPRLCCLEESQDWLQADLTELTHETMYV